MLSIALCEDGGRRYFYIAGGTKTKEEFQEAYPESDILDFFVLEGPVADVLVALCKVGGSSDDYAFQEGLEEIFGRIYNSWPYRDVPAAMIVRHERNEVKTG